jgi:hypothetical protein
MQKQEVKVSEKGILRRSNLCGKQTRVLTNQYANSVQDTSKKVWFIVSVMHTMSEVCTVDVRQENEFCHKYNRQATRRRDVG